MAQKRRMGNELGGWRFLLFLAVLATSWIVAAHYLSFAQTVLLGFDVAAAVFLLSCTRLLAHHSQDMREAAVANDAGRVVRLVISILLALVVFAAMTAQIVDRGALSAFDKALVAASLALVWLFANTMYALHYAHLYYSAGEDGRERGGLQFPGTREPLMADFAYFAFTIGVAVQTADVAINSRRIRKVVTVHAIVGFLFNIGVLALTINVLGGG